MAQKEIEMILARHLATYLAMPVFIVDTQGTLVFYNEPAERILGLRFEETGEIGVPEWTTRFTPTDAEGAPLPPGELPLVVAMNTLRPTHRSFYIFGLDQVRRHIEVTAFPVVGQADRYLGAMALFWELDQS